MPGPTPLSLGDYAFVSLGFSFNEMGFDLQTPSADVEVAGRMDALHWCGPKSEQRTIKGVLFPAEFGGEDSLQGLAAAAKRGEVMPLVTGGGDILGNYRVISITHEQTAITARGGARKLSYTITVRRIEGDAGGLGGLIQQLFSI